MGTIPTIATLASGAVVTSAYLNSIKAANDFWALTPRCYAYQNSSQSLTHNVNTPIALDSEIYDIVQSGDTPSHDLVTTNSRIFVRTSGKYEITGQVYFATNGTGNRAAEVRLNAAGNPASGTRLVLNQQVPAAGNSTPATCPTVEAALVAGDYIELFASQTSGGALSLVTGSALTFLRMKLTGS